MPISYLMGTGWWIAWYLLLWSLALPFVVFAVALARTAPNQISRPVDLAFAWTSVAWFGLVLTVSVAAVFWTRAALHPSFWIYLRNVAIAAVLGIGLALVVGFPAGMYAGSHTYPMRSRLQAMLICLGVAALLLGFCFHAAWRLRQR